MTIEKSGGFAPHLGLERIARHEEAGATLPAHRETQLTGEQVRHWVGELFEGGSLAQTLRAFASPRVADPAILAPTRFEGLVRDSARELRALADGGVAPSSGQPLSPEERTCLAEAAAILDEELELRELLSGYRATLVRA